MDITLALGGGGARGNAHIGVIRRLEKEGYRVRAVAGTSFGGIVAVLYATGLTVDEIERRFVAIDQSRLYSLTPHHNPSILDLTGAEKWLRTWLGNRTFEDLRLPCAVTAVDLKHGREVILDHGSLVDAVLSTIAAPGIFPPHLNGGAHLVDGAVLDPVPVAPARSLAPNLPVVAVVLTPLGEPGTNRPHIQLPVPIPTAIIQRISGMRLAQALSTFMTAVDVGSRMLTELRLAVDDPEVVIRPAVSHIGLLDKVDVRQVALLGEEAAAASLAEVRQSVSWTNRLRRNLFPRRQP